MSEKEYNGDIHSKEIDMIPEAQEYYNIAAWQKNKVEYNRISKFNSNKRRQILHGQIWFCDMGYNIGTEKNISDPIPRK